MSSSHRPLPAKATSRTSIALVLSLALAAAPSLVAGGCSRSDASTGAAAAKKAEAAVPVMLGAAQVQSVQRSIEAVGTLFADEDAVIAAKVPGRILTISRDVGDRVASGEALAQIDPMDYRLAVEHKRLAMRETLAKLGLDAIPKADFDPAQVPMVQRAKLQEENVRSRFARGKRLFEQTPPRISEQEFEDLRTALDVAARNLDVERLSARAILEEARAKAGDLAIAQQRLDDALILAPAAPVSPTAAPAPAGSPKGRSFAVAARMVSVGEYVREGTAMFRLVDASLIKLRAQVPERHAGQIALGQKVRVTVESHEGEFWGEVRRISPQVDPASRTFEVEAHCPNPDRLLKPGAFARARIMTRVDPSVVFVPQQSLVSFAGVNKVFTVAEGKAKAIDVEVGAPRGEWVEVRRGLRGDEPLVTAGATKLATDVPVKVEPPAQAPASGGASGAPAAAASSAPGGPAATRPAGAEAR